MLRKIRKFFDSMLTCLKCGKLTRAAPGAAGRKAPPNAGAADRD